jgi:DNA-binding Lrp family transcriptional regulator
MLITNPKKPFFKIAKEIGVSPITPISRYKKMKKDGVFFDSSTILDLSKIGYQGKAFLFIKSNKDYDEKIIIEKICNISNIFLVVEIVGAFDVLAMAVFKNLPNLKEIIDSTEALTGVEKVEFSITENALFPFKEEYCDIDPFK